jgi:hypothetical protein
MRVLFEDTQPVFETRGVCLQMEVFIKRPRVADESGTSIPDAIQGKDA